VFFLISYSALSSGNKWQMLFSFTNKNEIELKLIVINKALVAGSWT